MSACPFHTDEGVSAAPDFSPGVVQDSEYLLRALFSPEHVRDGKVLSRAISLQDLQKRGFSVHRIEYVSRDYVLSLISKVLARPRSEEPWTDAGVAILHTEQVRSLQMKDERAFRVIDIATYENPGHAAIYAAQPWQGKAHARELRQDFVAIVARSNFRAGRLRKTRRYLIRQSDSAL